MNLGGIMSDFQSKLRNFAGLSLSLAKAEFKLRNEGSYLGIIWYLLDPLLMFLVLLVIFSGRMGEEIIHYPMYLLLGIVMFNFFQKVTLESTRMIMGHRHIIKSIKFPHEVLNSSVVLKTLLSHLFEMIVIAAFLVYYGVGLNGLLLYSLILIPFTVFIFSASIILSSLYVYFVDIENIWAFLSRILWFATPIFYSIEPGTRLYKIGLLNPLYYFLTMARDVVIYGRTPEAWLIAGGLGFTILTLFFAVFLFKKLDRRLPELI
ncbi:MAG: ABC transporter permease [Methanobacteriota archaeon]